MYAIETLDLTKLYGRFCANDKINIAVEKGEIRAIIGENGAGKTTFLNMLYGMISPSSGEIRINGTKVNFSSPKDAVANGIGMVHQHFKLASNLTVYENIVLGQEITRFGLIDRKKERQTVEELIKKYSFELSLEDKVKDISIGAQQRVEILKMLYRNVDVLFLDEPTSVLTPQEADELIQNLMELNMQGKTIIVITHKLDEAMKFADKITVLRKGRMVDTVLTKDVTPEDLATMMVGRPVILRVDKGVKNVDMDQVIYQVDGFSVVGPNGRDVVKNVSFKVHKGEILGIAGIEGNGQSELVKALYGMMTCRCGEVKLKGKNVTNAWPNSLRSEGMGIVPEDRYAEGLCSEMKISQNLIAGYHTKAPVYKKPFFKHGAIKANMEHLVKQYDIRISDGDSNVSALSGGNAQKIIIAREFSANPDFLLCSQPTRGVDVGSIESIHQQIIEFRKSGKAILLVSSELSEIISLSDRILVMYDGEFTGEFDADQVSAEELGLYMTGAKRNI